MTAEQLREIEARAAADYDLSGNWYGDFAGVCIPDVKALLAHVAQVQAERDALRAALKPFLQALDEQNVGHVAFPNNGAVAFLVKVRDVNRLKALMQNADT